MLGAHKIQFIEFYKIIGMREAMREDLLYYS